jgi:hypothetical protein
MRSKRLIQINRNKFWIDDEDGEILHRQFWLTTAMQSGDRLEIATIVGDG